MLAGIVIVLGTGGVSALLLGLLVGAQAHDALRRSLRHEVTPAHRPQANRAKRPPQCDAGEAALDKFVARLNADHYSTRLRTESDPRARSVLNQLLIEEEKKLGGRLEQLAYIEHEIATLREWIARQQSRASRGMEEALPSEALLGMLYDTMGLYEEHRATLVHSPGHGP